MAMKLFVRIFLSVLLVLAIAACSPVARSLAVQLPPALVAVVGIVVMVVITGAFKWIGSKIGQDLSDQAKIVAAALASIVVLAINYGLGLIPAAYDNFISALFSFLIVLLGGTGLYSFWKRTR
jgi:hypothetical protein